MKTNLIIKTNLNLLQTRIFCAVALGIGSSFGLVAATENSADTAPATTAIPWSQLGAKAGADYQGDALAVIPTAEGARLRCVFQRLEGEATREGLWLTSTVTNAVNDRFRIVAAEVGRAAHFGVRRQSAAATPLSDERMLIGAVISKSGVALRFPPQSKTLPPTGNVSIDSQSVRFTRPGLVEEYTASMDGVRQDFVVLERPPGLGELVLRLAVSGARVESAAFGARVVLANSGRKIAYSRLRVTDAMGKELTAHLQVASDMPAPATLAVVVNDAAAVYPVRIDPTFSDANWSSMGGIAGANSLVYAAVVDGSGNLYIGGGFTIAGVVANQVAKWSGSSWSALGSGLSGGNYPYVSALVVSGSDLYAGGSFTTAGGHAATNVAKWNGSSWSALGSGMNGDVRALAVSGTDLYAGGLFTTAGGSAASYIARWDGSSWTALGSGIGNVPRFSSIVSALAVSGSNLYAGGEFTTAGGNAATNIAKWDGNSWTALGSGMNGAVNALAVSGSTLYAGGGAVAKWDGSTWSALGSGMGSAVFALAVSGNDVYAAGGFSTAGGSPANYIAKWNGSSWSALGSEVNDYVFALAVSGTNLYAGGEFQTAGGNAANRIAKWDGSSWTALGSGGMNGEVNALAVSGDDVYAAGGFTTAGGILANSIAKWDGSSWSPLGSGMDSWVRALAVSGSNLYAAGEFSTAGGSPANSIAKWDGSSWSALGSGMNGTVVALAVSGNDLYVGGSFTTAGGHAATNVAKWNGSSWSALGSGLSGGDYNSVYALAVSGSNVYVGGSFTTAGGHAATNVAKWNGSSWSGLSGGDYSSVYALAVSGSNVYVGGSFTTAGGIAATNIAKWDGSSWSALGSGINGGVSALAVSGNNLYAGGYFTTAGGKVSAYIARAYLPALPTLSVLRSSENVTVSWPTVDTAGFALEQTGALAAPAGWVTNSATVTDDGTTKSVTIPATNSSQFFRLRRP